MALRSGGNHSKSKDLKLRNNQQRYRMRKSIRAYSKRHEVKNANAQGGTRIETQRDRVTKNQRIQRKRWFAIGSISLLLALIISAAVGYFAYVDSLNKGLSLGMTDDVRNVLESNSTEPAQYYLLLGTDTGVDLEVRADTIMLLRIDSEAPLVTALSIPRDLMLPTGGTHYQKASSLFAQSGAKALIVALNDYLEIDINHYLETDFVGFKAIIDCMDGVEVNVASRIEDQSAGLSIIEPGSQVLSGDAALVLARSKDLFKSGDLARTENQRLILQGILQRVLDTGSKQRFFKMDTVAESLCTDLEVKDFLNLAKSLQDLDLQTQYYSCCVPVKSKSEDGILYYYAVTAELESMMERMDQGLYPVEEKQPASESIIPSEYTVTVRNGAGIAGVAGDCASKLEDAGYVVEETANANFFVYDNTLVIYRSDDNKLAAEAICETLGIGHTVFSYGAYAFETDLLVVVGMDWKP